jgi:hypothetical protein
MIKKDVALYYYLKRKFKKSHKKFHLGVIIH